MLSASVISFSFLSENFIKFSGVLHDSFKIWKTKIKTKFCKGLNSAQLISHVTDNLTILPRITIEIKQIKFIATHAETLLNLNSFAAAAKTFKIHVC